MDPIAQLLAERACRRLLLDLVRRLDLDEPGSVAELFTEDGVWTWPEGDRLVKGRAALRAHFGSRPADRHARRLMADVRVEVTSPDTARATSYFTTYRMDPAPGPAPVGIGHYEDTLHRTPDGSWLLAARTLRLPCDRPTPRL
ncbi:nuclear transport factor 2 family protein [Streptomyces sp. NBC_00582]|uniref:nuclear transport factor 2 family protein n=1 Tax=Streptomyces sp. NBC_00582 TaxID=2975783 RepID=UPI002E7FCC20|nr:nuclear transport factor 2 family protein [Streptomyces sp. NBC_00582]WUB65060.1 nuclear transport factor 2 family protein [Streptomyces sp. NBC_00582]